MSKFSLFFFFKSSASYTQATLLATHPLTTGGESRTEGTLLTNRETGECRSLVKAYALREDILGARQNGKAVIVDQILLPVRRSRRVYMGIGVANQVSSHIWTEPWLQEHISEPLMHTISQNQVPI